MNKLRKEKNCLENWRELDKKCFRRKLKMKPLEVKIRSWNMS